MVAVLVELAGETAPVRHFFAVGQEDRNRAEWAAIDAALTLGPVAGSPASGLEPVDAFARLKPQTVRSMALAPGAVRPLGRAWPRRWLG